MTNDAAAADHSAVDQRKRGAFVGSNLRQHCLLGCLPLVFAEGDDGFKNYLLKDSLNVGLIWIIGWIACRLVAAKVEGKGKG